MVFKVVAVTAVLYPVAINPAVAIATKPTFIVFNIIFPSHFHLQNFGILSFLVPA